MDKVKIIVPIFLMTYVSLGHLHRQYINYLGWDLDFTGSQMVITMKLYMLAFNLYDGKVLSEGKEDRASKKCAAMAVKEIPGFVEYMGYCFNFSTILVGPAYEYKVYEAACNGSVFYNKDGSLKGKIPSNVWPTFGPLLASLTCLGLFLTGGQYFPLQDPTDPQKNVPVIISEEFLQKSFIGRFLYIQLSLLIIRMRYYFAWKNSQGSNNIWYAGFEGFDDKGNQLGWEHSNNIDIITFETASNLKTLTGAWNKKTANWLGKYIYIRTGGSLVMTYGMSAFWHGFYPGYYLFFLWVPVLTQCERLGRKKLTPIFGPESTEYSPWGIVCMITTKTFVNYGIVGFLLLSYAWTIKTYSSLYWFGHVVPIIFFAILSILPSPKKKKE